jgi:hypothetical protein
VVDVDVVDVGVATERGASEAGELSLPPEVPPSAARPWLAVASGADVVPGTVTAGSTSGPPLPASAVVDVAAPVVVVGPVVEVDGATVVGVVVVGVVVVVLVVVVDVVVVDVVVVDVVVGGEYAEYTHAAAPAPPEHACQPALEDHEALPLANSGFERSWVVPALVVCSRVT